MAAAIHAAAARDAADLLVSYCSVPMRIAAFHGARRAIDARANIALTKIGAAPLANPYEPEPDYDRLALL